MKGCRFTAPFPCFLAKPSQQKQLALYEQNIIPGFHAPLCNSGSQIGTQNLVEDNVIGTVTIKKRRRLHFQSDGEASLGWV